MKDYAINVFSSDEDECSIGVVPDLEGCSAFGDTPAEAVHELMIAKEPWLEVARGIGLPSLPPRYHLAAPPTSA